MKIKLICISIYLLTSCGADEPERDYDNPLDPDKEVSESSVNEPAESGETTEDTTSVESACLLGGCSLPENAAFNFSQKFNLTPSGCSQISALKVFHKSPDFQVFLQANCEDRLQVYTYEIDEDSMAIGALTNLTQVCDSGTTGVTNMDASNGFTGFGVAFECKHDSNDYRRYITTLDSGSGSHQTTQIEQSSSTYPIKISWNHTALAYGIARSGKFFRYDQDAAPIGGPIFITSNMLHGFSSVDGEWVIFHSSYGDRDRCSKVSSIGTLLCNAKTIDSGVYGILGDSSVFRIDSSFRFLTSSFDSSSCSTSNESSSWTPTNKDYNGNKGFQGLELSSNLSAFLFQTKQNLVVATFPRSGTFSIQAESSVTGFTSLTSASMLKAKNKLYVPYIKDGEAYVSISVETIE